MTIPFSKDQKLITDIEAVVGQVSSIGDPGRPGIKTTEFWMTMIPQALAVIVTLFPGTAKVLGAFNADTIRSFVYIGAGIAVAVYTASRTLLKHRIVTANAAVAAAPPLVPSYPRTQASSLPAEAPQSPSKAPPITEGSILAPKPPTPPADVAGTMPKPVTL